MTLLRLRLKHRHQAAAEQLHLVSHRHRQRQVRRLRVGMILIVAAQRHRHRARGFVSAAVVAQLQHHRARVCVVVVYHAKITAGGFKHRILRAQTAGDDDGGNLNNPANRLRRKVRIAVNKNGNVRRVYERNRHRRRSRLLIAANLRSVARRKHHRRRVRTHGEKRAVVVAAMAQRAAAVSESHIGRVNVSITAVIAAACRHRARQSDAGNNSRALIILGRHRQRRGRQMNNAQRRDIIKCDNRHRLRRGAVVFVKRFNGNR